MSTLQRLALTLSILFSLKTNAQELAFSAYQTPEVTGFFTNNGRISDQNGNVRSDIHAAFQGKGFQAFFTSTGWFYQINRSLNKPKSPIELLNKTFRDTLSVQRVHFTWLFTTDPGNRYTLSDPAGPLVNVYRENSAFESLRAHKNMTWKSSAEGIRFDFTGMSNVRMKYNIVVDAGADTEQLSCIITGADRIHLKDDGKTLEIATLSGTIEEHIPLSWQILPDGTKIPIAVRWTLHEDTASFILPENYNPMLPLVIDPWSTYLGGTGGGNYEYGEDVTTDASLNVYATGYTTSLFNIATSGTFQTTLSGAEDIYLIRYNSNGTRQWCTYYGGITTDYASSVSATGTNLLIMSMSTYSSGLATTGTHQPNQQGSIDGLICRMNPANGQRIWATYYGGSSDDFSQAVHTDAAGNIFICGYTFSNSGIATSGAFKTSLAFNDQDAFIARFSSAGARIWGTYFGGGNFDVAFDVITDASGNVIIGGYTFSQTNISTSGTHQTILRGNQDGFIARFNASGVRLWGTYFGGNQDETVFTVATDASGRVYAGGYTNSTTFIATPGAFRTTSGGFSDAFLFRLNSNGTMNYATYYGGENDDVVYGIKTDGLNNTYFCGYTTSVTSIATTGARQTSLAGISDGFVGKFNNAGSSLWCTYYGGPDFEFCRNLTLDATANVIITGYTSSTTGIAVNAAQSTLTGFVNAFVAKYTTNGVLPVTWLNVSAKPEKDNILVEWSTSTETNNEFFTVEHSVDGNIFEALDMINGAGNSTIPRSYSYLHIKPGPGTHYYRIRQTDFNGTFDYSIWVSASTTIPLVDKPILIKNGEFITLASDKDGEAPQVLYVFNSTGMVCDVKPSIDNGRISFSMQGYAPGMYFVTCTQQNQQFTLKFIY